MKERKPTNIAIRRANRIDSMIILKLGLVIGRRDAISFAKGERGREKERKYICIKGANKGLGVVERHLQQAHKHVIVACVIK